MYEVSDSESNESLAESFNNVALYIFAVPKKLSILLPTKFKFNKPDNENFCLLMFS